MVRVRWLKMSSIIVENCLYEYELRGKKCVIRIFLQILWILFTIRTGVVHSGLACMVVGLNFIQEFNMMKRL